MSTNLVSVTVYLANGTHYHTSVNGKNTDAEISAYFVGQLIDVSKSEQETFSACVSVKVTR